MTAKQYVRRRDFFIIHSVWAILVLVFLTAIIAARCNHVSLFDRTLSYKPFCLIFLSTIIVAGLAFGGFHFLDRRLVKKHPEMAFIHDWEVFGHSVDSYPTTDAEKALLAPGCLAQLINLAEAVNTAIFYRDKLPSVKLDVSEGVWQEIQVLKNLLADEFKLKDGYYLQYWDLVVRGIYVKQRALEIVPVPLLSPQEFRERLNAQWGDILD